MNAHKCPGPNSEHPLGRWCPIQRAHDEPSLFENAIRGERNSEVIHPVDLMDGQNICGHAYSNCYNGRAQASVRMP
jgi:hypothetical protein